MQTDEIRKYQARIEQSPRDLAAYEVLERLYTRGEQWAELVDLYRQKAAHIPELGEKRLLWQKVARVAEEMLDDPGLAITMARDILPAEALDRATLRVIEGLCRRHKRWDELRHFLSVVAKSADDKLEGLAALHRLGELLRHELADPPAALTAFCELVKLQPRHPEALAALNELLTDDELRADASAALEAAYRASADWDKLFKLFERLLDADVMEDDARADLLHRKAALVEERRGPEAAFPEFAKAFLESQRDACRVELERIASRAGLWRDLLQVYLRSLEGSKGDASGNAILQRAAEIAEENLGLKAVAEKCYRQLLDFDTGNADALTALERLYVESGDDASLLGILELRITLAQERLAEENLAGEKPAEKGDAGAAGKLAEAGTEGDEGLGGAAAALRTLYARAGDIAEHRLGRIPVAIEKYEALLRVAPGDDDARSALLRLYPRAARWQDLVDHLLRHAGEKELADVRRRVAEIYEEKLRDLGKAIAQLVQLRQALPADPRALESLTRLYERTDDHAALLEVLEARARHAATPAERWTLRLRTAEVLRRGLGRPLDAADTYGEILGEARSATAGEEARRALEELLGKGPTRARAATLLESHYEGAKSWQRLVDFYDRVLPDLPGAAERARALEAVAYIYEHHLGSPERAFWSYGRALKEHPASPFAEREILRIAIELSFQDQLAGLLEDALDTLFGEVASPPPMPKPVSVQVQEKAPRPVKSPTKRPPRDEEVEEKTSVISEAEILDAAELELADAEELFEADETGSAEELGEVDLVLDEDAAEIDEVAAEIDEGAAEIDEDDGVLPTLVLALCVLSTAVLSDAVRSEESRDSTGLRFCLRLASLNEEILDRPEAAAAWYRRVRALDAGHAGALQALDRLAGARGDQEELRDVLRARVERAKKADDELALRLRLGALLETHFQDADGAVAEYRAALAAAPERHEPFDALEAALRREGRAQALADLYRAALERAADRSISLKLAALLRDGLQTPEDALVVLRPLIAADARDEEALTAFERAALEAGYDRDSRAEELLGVIQSLRDLAPTPAAWRERERRIGELLETALDRKADAVQRYARVLGEDGEDEKARTALERLAREQDTLEPGAAVLEPYYRQRQEWQSLIGLLELRLEAAAQGPSRAALYAEIARISEEHARDGDAGFLAYAKALREEPQSATYLEAVDRLASELGRFEELCELLDDTAVARELEDTEPGERVYVLQRLAEVASTSLGDRERAVAAYKQALVLQPDNNAIFRALEELYAHLERWRDLADLFRSALEREPENRAYALRLADLLEVILESPEEALDVLRAMLERNPKDPEALRAFEGVFTRAGIDKTPRAGELIPVLESLRTEVEAAAQKRAYEFRIGELLEQSLARPDDSVERYGHVLGEDPGHGGALIALERLSLRASCRVAACALLEAHYRAQRAYGPLSDVLERRLLDVVPHDERAALYAEVGGLRETKLGDAAAGLAAYAKAFEEQPSAADLLAAVERLGAELARHEELAFLLEAGADALEQPGAQGTVPHRVGMLVFLATLYRDILTDAPAAIRAFERAHALQPSGGKVFTALEELYTGETRHAALAELYRGQLRREPGDRQTGLKLARVLDQILDKAPEALEVLRALLARDEKDVDVLRAFDGIFVGAGLHTTAGSKRAPGAEELLPILLRLRDAHAGSTAREYEFRAGALRELALGQRPESVPHYAAVLLADHAHAGARTALERLLQDPAIRPAVTEVLDPYYRKEEAWRPLIALLELRQGDAKKPKERAKLLAELGGLAEERLRDSATAFGAYARAFQSRPEERALFEAISRLGAEQSSFEELAALLTEGSQALAEEKRKASTAYRVEVLQKLATTASSILGDNERAIEALTSALALDDENDLTLTALDKLYTAEGRARELAAILERELGRVDAAPAVYVRAELLRRLAHLREEVFGDLDAAAQSFEALREQVAEDGEARQSLERLYEATGRSRDLADLLLATTPQTKEGAVRLHRAALLLEENVGDVARAREVFAQLHLVDEDDLEALRGLMRVLSRPELTGRERELLAVYEALRARADDERGRADLLHKEGALLAGPLAQPEEAAERFTKALELVPGHREAVLALESLAQRAEVRDVAVPRLERHYERVGAWQALVELYETVLPSRTPDARRELLARMAGIYEKELRNPRLAFREYSRLFREAPDRRDVLDVLERLAQEMGSFERLANLYDEFLREIPDKALGLHLTLRLARLYEETLGRRTLAVERYRFALELDPSSQVALDALDRVYVAVEDWPHLQKILERKLDLAAPAAQVELHGRMGTLYERELGFAGAAVDAFEAALALSPADEPSIAALERIFAQRDDLMLRQHIADTLRPHYQARGEQRRLAGLDLGIAEVLQPMEREPFLLDAARVHEGLGEAEGAFRILLQGLLEGCLTEQLVAGAERLAHVTGGWQELCRATDSAAGELPEDSPKREELTLRAARWYFERLSNAGAAEQRYSWVFLRDPAASPAFRALEGIHTAVFDADKLLDLYRRRLAVVRAKDERAALLKRSGDLCADFLHRDEEALFAYEEALRMRPDDGEVLEALVPLYERTHRFSDLCRVLGRQLERAQTGEEKFVLHRRLAEVFGAELSDDGNAILHYRAALELVPTDLELWRALRWHCARAKRGADLAMALQRELELTTEPAERAAVARELAQVEEAEGRLGEAADALRVVLEIDARDADAAARYERFLEKVERWTELGAFYDGQLAAVLEVPERVRILGALAAVAEKHLSDPGRAAAALAQRCELKPDDLAALRELARIYDQQGRWKECFEFLKAQVKRVDEVGEVAVELLCRMGLLCEERAKNIDVAEKCYQRALSIEGRSRLALDGLKRVYVHRVDHGRVAQVLQAQETLASGEERAALATERGILLRDHVADLPGAVAAFEAALTASPLHADAAVAMVELAEKGVGRERARANLLLLVEVFAKTRRIKDRHLALHKLGALAEEAGEAPKAIAAFEAAYQAASTHLPTLLSLARLYYDSGHWEKALKMLQILLLNEGSLPTPADRVELFHRLGAIRQKMGERARAINMFQRALEIDPLHAPSRKAMQDLIG